MAETKKYLDQAGLVLVLRKLTNKYDQRFLGLHATADAAQKTVHSLTINVGDEEQRVFDGQADHAISVAAKVHGHKAEEVSFSHSGMSNVATVDQALDVLIKNVQIASGVLSSTTANMNSLQEALDQEKADRAAADEAEAEARELADTGLDNRIKALEELLNGSGNVNEAILAVIERLAAEEQRSLAKDNEHDSAIADHKSRLETIEGEVGVEGSIKHAVNEEKVRAEAKEAELDAAIKAEASRADTEEKRIDKKLDDEIAARGVAEEALSQRITANKNAIDLLNADENTEGSVAKDIKDAEARVKVVTDKLDGRMTGAEARLDVIQGEGEGSIKKAVADLVDGAPETLDTLNELAAALRDDKDVLTAIETAFNGKLDAEKQAREAKEKEHEGRMEDIEKALAQEVQDRKDAVPQEANARIAEDEKLSGRISVIEGIIEGDEGTTLKDIIEDIAENAQAIETETKERKAADEAIQAQLNKVDGDAQTDGSFRNAIAAQAATQLAKDNAQDARVKALEDKVGNDGGTATESTGLVATLRGAIESEASTRKSEDDRLEGRIADIEELIGDGEGSTTLADLNERLTQAEKDIDANEKGIADNKAAIAAIVALEETDIDAAFAAVFQ